MELAVLLLEAEHWNCYPIKKWYWLMSSLIETEDLSDTKNGMLR